MKNTLKKAIIVITAAMMIIASAVPAAAASEIAITSVTFPTVKTVKVGQSQTLTVTTAPANATNKTAITWSLDEAAKKVINYKANGTGTLKSKNSSITITGKAAGTGTITTTIKTYNNAGKVLKTFVKKTKVTVVKAIPLKSITLSKTSTTLNVNATQTLSINYNPSNTNDSKTATWTSSNTAVATVSAGKITAKKPGTATITAKVGTKTATCKVTVKAPLTKLVLNKTTANMVVGNTTTLTVSYTPSNTTDSKTVTWTTSNSAVVTVSGGKLTAKKAGTATITAKVGTKTATCSVVVTSSAIPGTGSVERLNTTECYNTLNQYRKNVGKAALKRDATLEKYAEIRAREIVVNFSHTRPNGDKGLRIIPGNLYKGENIAKGQRTCASVMTAWYNSAGHRENMLDKNYTKVGIVGIKYNGTMYWVQLFSS